VELSASEVRLFSFVTTLYPPWRRFLLACQRACFWAPSATSWTLSATAPVRNSQSHAPKI
jgi:hypothetical protein